MRIAIALISCAGLLVATACGGSQPPPSKEAEKPADTAAESCCCKFFQMASDDGLPLYEVGNRIECSTKQGTCVDEVQCQKSGAQPKTE